jgi:hypothetical protein
VVVIAHRLQSIRNVGHIIVLAERGVVGSCWLKKDYTPVWGRNSKRQKELEVHRLNA